MSICMTGIDWESANMNKREAFSFTNHQAERMCARIRQIEGIAGCVLLSTCNRTELYLSGADSLEPAKLLCRLVEAPDAEAWFTTRRGTDAERHLMAVSCGLCSQILGEDQIVSQVKRAYQLAHAADSADAPLSQLFRLAATAGKRSRTQVRLSAAPLSVAGQAVELISNHLDTLDGKRALVIGNGEMGRLASSLLTARGCAVTVTLRSYRHGQTIVPAGCQTISYDDRMREMERCDILISATTSPHYTVTCQDLRSCAHIPAVICDLSMPRDIEPTVRELNGVQAFWDMDSMGGRETYVNADDRRQVEAIIEEQLAEFDRWCAYREALPLMDELCRLSAERVTNGYDFDVLCDGEDADTIDKMEHAARLAAEKTARLLLSGLQSELSGDALDICRQAILRKAPQLRQGG